MAVEFANIIFDERYRPSDALEDRLSEIETKASAGLRRLDISKTFDDLCRVDVAMLLAVQACRYPELYPRRLDIAKYFAIAIQDNKGCTDADALNRKLAAANFPVRISSQEFNRLSGTPDQEIENELLDILAKHGYESDFNPNLIIDAAISAAEHILGLKWTLYVSASPAFILSDHPVPPQIKYGFSVGISSSLALRLSHPGGDPVEIVDVAAATQTEIDKINQEVRSRAVEWICGPGAFVHQL